ncbi:MAG: SAM-dependent methyltransferase [Clostridia bacterium]|nr:SAM-dependent methyltransferase [Clostridia bacterium]
MMTDKRISLDARLTTLAEMVGKVQSFADVGCDHGRLGAYLLQRGWVQRAWFGDISDVSLEKARRLVRMLGYEQNASFWIGDGLNGLSDSVNAIVISGMGGDTIAGILARGQARIGSARLLLGANVGHPELRGHLCATGFRIVDERVVVDHKRCYVLIEAVRGVQKLTDFEREIGPVLCRTPSPERNIWRAFRIRVAKKALDGAIRGNDRAEINRLKSELEIWEALDFK